MRSSKNNNPNNSTIDISLKWLFVTLRCLRQALDCINQIRVTQSEIRLLQQQQRSPLSLLSSPKLNNSQTNTTLTSFSNMKLNMNASMSGHDTSSLMANGNQAADDSDTSKLFKKLGSTTTMRRGVLMSILQQAALTLPLWVGEIGQSPPPL